jgi:hypothetical protein
VKRIVLISCVSKKLAIRARASDMYLSPLFRRSWLYAEKLLPDAVFILSAKYGLLDPVQEIEPYDITLNTMSSRERMAWADRVLIQLKRRCDFQKDHFVFLAGRKYRAYLVPSMASYEVPMQGLSIGKQLQYLKRHTDE